MRFRLDRSCMLLCDDEQEAPQPPNFHNSRFISSPTKTMIVANTHAHHAAKIDHDRHQMRKIRRFSFSMHAQTTTPIQQNHTLPQIIGHRQYVWDYLFLKKKMLGYLKSDRRRTWTVDTYREHELSLKIF